MTVIQRALRSLTRDSRLLVLLGALATVARAQEESAFPPDDPARHGIAPEALARLSTFAKSVVDSGEIVGCEIAVIHDGRTLLHESYGWRDKEEGRAMENGTLFCVRSMTKPLVGAAIQMLIDERKLALSDRISSYLPSFDTDASRKITVEMLLEHTSGLPLSNLLGGELEELQSIREVADRAGALTPDFEPGTRFQYSDTGTDTLTALVEVVSGRSIEEFLNERILGPLAMKDAVLVMREDEPRRARASSQYTGAKDAWIRFWNPKEKPVFRFFLGSQGMYCTIEDYARFLDMWAHFGRVKDERLLSLRAVKRALAPGPNEAALPTGFQSLRASYGQLMELLLRKGEGDKEEVFGFGHTGSDGTLAWVFPEKKLMVFYFTQSRGSLAILSFEHEVETALLGETSAPAEPQPPLDGLVGFYREPSKAGYRRLYEKDGRLMLEAPGAMMLTMRYLAGGRWTFDLDPSTTIRFEQDEAGLASAVLVEGAGVSLRVPRMQIEEGLPSGEELHERHLAAHHWQRLADVPAVRLKGKLDLPTRKAEGTWEMLLAAPDRFRTDIQVGPNHETTSVDGTTVLQSSQIQKPGPLEGRLAVQAVQSSWGHIFGDWKSTFPRITPLYRAKSDGVPVIVVRAESDEGPSSTFLLDEESGRVLGVERLLLLPGLGDLGASVRFYDWRDVAGMSLPFRVETEYPTPLLGTITLQIESAETLAELPANAFAVE
jgi:CubicO group peptidase (beta-lactamase class C family)